MALILNIDSSLETASVSIARDGEILKVELNTIQKEHASFLHSAIQRLTNELQITLENLDAIGCTIGPGSYTGLRVGLAAAKGFCYALDKPLISIGTLEAMAHSMMVKETNNELIFCPMIDARRMEVYTALYGKDLKELKPAHATVIDQSFCADELQDNKILFFGNGMEKFKKVADHPNAIFKEIGDIFTSISDLSFKNFRENIFAPLAASAPLYAKEFYNGV